MATLLNMVHTNEEVLRVWTTCVNDQDEQHTLLLDVIEEWITLRGHSMANMELEKYKKKKAVTTQKKRSLRKELHRQTK